jgi:antitoxin component YwqK of YwqJK toxin-antitoxin module
MTTNPTTVEYYENGQIKYQEWLINGKLHNENGPTRISYYENGQIHYQNWKINDKFHNENGPSYISYYENGQILLQSWAINGNRHNENGPADIWYYENGQIQYQTWWINGIRHNENGPYSIYYYKNGQIKYQKWYINGKELSDLKIIIQKEIIEKRKIAINVISKNWLISKWNGKYREFLTQLLTVPENHDSIVGKLFPTGGYDYKKFKKSLLTF